VENSFVVFVSEKRARIKNVGSAQTKIPAAHKMRFPTGRSAQSQPGPSAFQSRRKTAWEGSRRDLCAAATTFLPNELLLAFLLCAHSATPLEACLRVIREERFSQMPKPSARVRPASFEPKHHNVYEKRPPCWDYQSIINYSIFS
jgi:hypothetical protein